jgi:hypothetical protein
MATQTGYKASELGMIPQDWDVVELGKVIKSITSGVSVNSIDEINKFPHGYHVLKTSCVANGYFDSSYAKSILPNEIFRAKNSVKKGNLIVSRMNTPLLVGELGYTKKDEPKIFLPDRLWQVEIKEDLANTQFLSFLLSYPLFAKVLKETATGTSDSMKNISKNNFSSLNIYLPPLSEQTAIATALSDTDALISSLQTLIAKKKAIKLSAMQNLLSGKIRLPEFALRLDGSPKTTRQTELGCVPEDWAVVELGDVGKTYGGLSGKNKSDFDRGDSFYVPFTNVMANLEVDKNQLGKVEVNEKQNAVLEGDLLFNGSSETPEEVCFASFVNFSLPNLFLNSFCFGFRLTKNTISPKYLAYWFRSEIGRKTIAFMSQGSTRYNISKSEFVKLKLVMPSKPEQTAIAQLLSDMDAEIESLEGRLKKTQSLKQGMMQALLTGKIRLPLE